MTKNELKKILYSYQDLINEKVEIEEELKKIESIMSSPKRVDVNATLHGSGTGDPMIGIVSKHIAISEKYRHKLEEISTAQMEIEALIEKLEPMERRLMRNRYLKGLPWEKVCLSLGYSLRQVHRKHNKILQKILENNNHLE